MSRNGSVWTTSARGISNGTRSPNERRKRASDLAHSIWASLADLWQHVDVALQRLGRGLVSVQTLEDPTMGVVKNRICRTGRDGGLNLRECLFVTIPSRQPPRQPVTRPRV